MRLLGVIPALLIAWFATPTQALLIEARLTSFQGTDASLNGSGPAGGIGRFELLTDVTGTVVDFLGSSFLAQCLEPDETINVGRSYQFEVVPLAQAPTSTGGMGTLHETWLKNIFDWFNFDSIEDVAASSSTVRSAIQMAVYEAGYEATNTFDWNGGSALLTGSGASLTGSFTTAVNQSAGDNLTMLGLLNVDQVPSPLTRTVYRAQDFMVVTATPVDEPDPGILMLMGLGLLGMTRFKNLT